MISSHPKQLYTSNNRQISCLSIGFLQNLVATGNRKIYIKVIRYSQFANSATVTCTVNFYNCFTCMMTCCNFHCKFAFSHIQRHKAQKLYGKVKFNITTKEGLTFSYGSESQLSPIPQSSVISERSSSSNSSRLMSWDGLETHERQYIHFMLRGRIFAVCLTVKRGISH